jgi:hypothetical protein
VLPHVGDVGRLLRQRHVQLAGDAVGQLDVTRVRKDASHRSHHLVNTHLKIERKKLFNI